MGFFDNFFKKPELECPRCLGKGVVDWQDIRRLDRMLKWLPGKCAYCKASGKVTKEMLAKVAVDNSYLTVDRPYFEQQKIRESDENALHRSKVYDEFLNGIISFVEKHYFSGNKNPENIADLYETQVPKSELFWLEREGLVEYIEKIIEHKIAGLN
ncbi:hypothetical protein [Flavobacterium sp.]|uniref:hypothetical protein n=1 Tax=Flavobacterium sp. TaxID=239 RepID=UPI001200816C|nr:hypothetical protein [Flavobacterium sp.]RZJ70182.1 MAG: hypothetical protein EOO49_14450 [Flavobacterium sp.]